MASAPNAIYRSTHAGLCTLVSSRVATHVLDGHLARAGIALDSVDREQMTKVLLGPVLRELQAILPRNGLKHSLRSIVRTLRKLERAAEAEEALRVSALEHAAEAAGSGAAVAVAERSAVAVVAPAEPEEATDDEALDEALDEPTPREAGEADPHTEAVAAVETVAAVPEAVADGAPEEAPEIDATPGPIEAADDEPDEAAVEAVGVEAETDEDADEATADPHAEVVAPAGIAASVATVEGAEPTVEHPVEHPVETLERVVLHFAQLEHVQLVAAVRRNGRVAVARGDGPDLDSLSRLGLSGLRLLGRSGRLRSYYLSHTLGQLFLLPLEQDTVIVVGTTELNLGGVFAALSALKEEL